MTAELTNHLWQSTLFAVAAGLLAFALRKNRAQIRYGLWLAASLKFLVPFSLLVGLGSHLGWAPAAKRIATQAASFTVLQIAKPFPETLPFVPSAPRTTDWPLIAILGVWACGFGLIVLLRFRSWLRIRAAVRSSTRLEIPAAVQVRSSPGLLEPGVVGLFKPVLLLPEGIIERLTSPQLDAVLAHEVCHVRRRDNLTAALHMFVEAVFWFHPLVWWIGVQLVKERERACDEEVLRRGSEPQVYAEGILNVCKFYMESPLACVAGVTGHNLRKRVELIVRNHVGEPLSAARKLSLATAAVAAVASPLILGLLSAPQLRAQSSPWEQAAGGKMDFEVASIRQNTSEKFIPPNFPLSPDNSYASTGGLFSADFDLLTYIDFAYRFSPSPEQRQLMLAHWPKWLTTDRFEIHARAAGTNPTKDQMRLMMQSLLADRFKLAVHFETHRMPVLAMRLAKPGKLGPKLRPHADGPPCESPATPPARGPSAIPADVFPPVCEVYEWDGRPGRLLWGARNTTMALVAGALPPVGRLDRTVIDQTGLSGNFDFTLQWTPESDDAAPPAANLQGDDLQETTFLEALREQLGLKLESQKGPVQVLVIDHVQKPSEN